MIRSLRVSLAACVLAVACGGGATTAPSPPSARPAPPAEASVPPMFVEVPSRWIHKRPQPSRILAKTQTDEGMVLFTGGERWLLAPDEEGDPQRGDFAGSLRGLIRPLDEDPVLLDARARAASTIVPDDVIGVAREGSGYLLVGLTGIVYPVETVLGPIGEARKPPQSLFSVVVGKSAILGIDGHDVVRSVDGGRAWSRSAIPDLPGTLVKLVMRGSIGLAVMWPQRLLVTGDDGASFSAIATSGDGVESVYVNKEGELAVKGAAHTFTLRGPPWKLEESKYAKDAFYFTNELQPQHLAPVLFGGAGHGFGRAMLEARAFFSDTRYLEFDAAPSGEWVLREIALATNARTTQEKATPVMELKGCAEVFGAAAEGTIVVACSPLTRLPCGNGIYCGPDDEVDEAHAVAVAAEARHVTLFEHTESTKGWRRRGELVLAAGKQRPRRAIWVSRDGAIVIQGACLPNADENCNGAPLIAPARGADFEPIALPEGIDGFYDVAFGSGQRVYAAWSDWYRAVGALLRSQDGGKTFAATRFRHPDKDVHGGHLSPGTYEARRRAGFVLDRERGLAAFVVNTYAGWAAFSTPDDGETLRLIELPKTVSEISVAGSRALAVEGPMSSIGWESADGMRTWRRVGVPRHDRGGLVCGSYGCGYGDALRIGWDGRAGSRGDTTFDAAPTKPPSPPPPPAYECTLLDEPWKPFDGDEVLIRAAPLARGTKWVGRTGVTEAAGIGLEIADVSAATLTIKKVALFTADAHGQKNANGLRGSLAATRAIPTGLAAQVDLDIAWYDPEADVVRRARIPKIGPVEKSQVSANFWQHQDGMALSVLTGGRAFNDNGAMRTYFVANDGAVTKLPGDHYPEALARTGKRWFTIRGSNVGWLRPDGKAWEWATWSSSLNTGIGTTPITDFLDSRAEGREEHPDGDLQGGDPGFVFDVMVKARERITRDSWGVDLLPQGPDPVSVFPVRESAKLCAAGVTGGRVFLESTRTWARVTVRGDSLPQSLDLYRMQAWVRVGPAPAHETCETIALVSEARSADDRQDEDRYGGYLFAADLSHSLLIRRQRSGAAMRRMSCVGAVSTSR